MMLEYLAWGPILAIPYLALLSGIALVVPSWRWVAGFILVVLAALAFFWLQHWMDTRRPGYDQGITGVFGVIMAICLTTAVGFGSAMYLGAVLWMHVREKRKMARFVRRGGG
jgi:asparagine N-glycosylation enzyme membrane subunit Stt3